MCNLEVPGATLKWKLSRGMQLGHPRTVLKGVWISWDQLRGSERHPKKEIFLWGVWS